jgi:hypothetical protein
MRTGGGGGCGAIFIDGEVKKKENIKIVLKSENIDKTINFFK